ncbi:MAG: twin-arginine translocation signal domain-containing protein [Streptosporangiaceae bacterium]|nr:twin-arginine translocation signal domain-containing protein [Streptosporangiaceae bacterium]
MSKHTGNRERRDSGPSRRGFIGAVGVAGGAAAISSISALRAPDAVAAPDAADAPLRGPGTADTPANDASLAAERRFFISPSAVTSVQGNVENAHALVNGGTATLTAGKGGTAPLVVLDYDEIVGGQPLFGVSEVTGDVTLQAIYSQSLPYLLPGGDGFGTNNDAGERTISFVGVPGGAQLSRVENYQITAPGPITGHLLQAGQRFQAITLLGSGSIKISGVGFAPSFRLDTPDDPRAGAFTCNDPDLGKIWQIGVHTVNTCSVPVGSVPPLYEATSKGLVVHGSEYTAYRPGDGWTDYTASFGIEILRNEASWLVRSDSMSTGTMMVLCAGDDTLPVSTPNTLRVYIMNQGPQALIAVVPMPFQVAANTVYPVTVTVAGGTLTVTIKGTRIYSGTVAGMRPSGSFGFANAQGALSRASGLTVTSSTGTVLLSQKLTGPRQAQTQDFIDKCLAGTNVTPSIMDGAMRDRLVWSGDMGISTLAVLTSTFDNQYLTGSAEQYFLYQNADGSIPIAVPAQGKGLAVTGTFGPPPSLSTQDYGMMQVTDAYNYWLFSGDTAWLRRNWTSVRGIMTWLTGQIGSNGLMSGAGPLATQMSTNAHFYGALHQAQQMATAVGDTASASAYASAAPGFGKTINSLLFNRAAGMYSASVSRPSVFDEIGNGYALLYGLPALDPTIDTAALAANLTKALAGPKGPCEDSSQVPGGNIAPYEAGWEALGRLASGHTQGALDLIRQVWGLMLPQNTPYYSGACWEYVAQTGLPGLGLGTSLAHGWAAGATPALSMYVLGGRPLTPGYRTFLAEPQPGDLTWAKGRVPTPHGPIIIDWTTTEHSAARFTLTVDVPPGTAGYAGVPSTATRGTVDGVITTPVTVPGYTGLPGYLYFGPLTPGRHRITAS